MWLNQKPFPSSSWRQSHNYSGNCVMVSIFIQLQFIGLLSWYFRWIFFSVCNFSVRIYLVCSFFCQSHHSVWEAKRIHDVKELSLCSLENDEKIWQLFVKESIFYIRAGTLPLPPSLPPFLPPSLPSSLPPSFPMFIPPILTLSFCPFLLSSSLPLSLPPLHMSCPISKAQPFHCTLTFKAFKLWNSFCSWLYLA